MWVEVWLTGIVEAYERSFQTIVSMTEAWRGEYLSQLGNHCSRESRTRRRAEKTFPAGDRVKLEADRRCNKK